METILSILIVLGCLIALLLLIALFIPKHYTVTVEETIKRPKEAVYAYVSLLGEQLAYSEWLMHDATLQSRLEGVDGTVGATLKWESRNPDKNKSAGKGELEIKAMDPDSIAWNCDYSSRWRAYVNSKMNLPNEAPPKQATPASSAPTPNFPSICPLT